MSHEVAYEIVIGLEVHAQLRTRTKLFCSDTTSFGAPPNTQVSAISLGHPGTLPRMNREVIPMAIKLGLACRCEIVSNNYFARKNYFYPDLPKGFQTSQHTTPICRNGYIEVPTSKGNTHVRINRIHMEEDAGKSSHDDESNFSSIDYNRAGMPLLEIVTEPDIRSAEEAAAYVTLLRKLVRHLEVCDGNMEEGSLRCDVNLSVRPAGEKKLGTRVEIKNLNSIRFIKKAIEFESRRLIDLHRKGGEILQQTRGFNESDGSTYAIRTKEDEDDYRYFPEPDLPPFVISSETIENIRRQMPPLPEAIKKQLTEEYGLSAYDAGLVADDPELTNIFHQLITNSSDYKSAANWVIGPIKNHLSGGDADADQLPINGIATLIRLIEEGKISYGIASQKVFPYLLDNPRADALHYIEQENLFLQSSQTELDGLVDAALNKHATKIADYKKGKKGLISVFVGEVMRTSQGKADARIVTEKILDKLKSIE
jgi:aspartyl-tRNA(Asn)/glutamyl-tRNA(Gln) amidotransferase subunit B